MVESDGSAKGIVFSQFTSFLDLINYSLPPEGKFQNCIFVFCLYKIKKGNWKLEERKHYANLINICSLA